MTDRPALVWWDTSVILAPWRLRVQAGAHPSLRGAGLHLQGTRYPHFTADANCGTIQPVSTGSQNSSLVQRWFRGFLKPDTASP